MDNNKFYTYTKITGIQYITIGDFGTTVFQNTGSGYVDGSYYFLDKVHITLSSMPSFTIAANPNPNCSGNITNITNSLNLPLDWTSTPSGYFSCPTACSSTNLTTSSQTTVTGTYSIAPNCNSTASTVVNYIAPIKPNVTGKFNTYDLTSLYTITNPQAGTSYSWSIYPPNCGNLNPNNGSNVSITWNPDNFPTDGYASVIITSSNGCTNRDTIKVWRCCNKAGTVLHDQTITTLTPWQTYAINGVVNFNGINSYNNVTLYMGQESKIFINTGASISFDNFTIIAGCDYMWEGITLNQGASITVNNSQIRDAFNAITSENGANYSLYNTVFNKN